MVSSDDDRGSCKDGMLVNGIVMDKSRMRERIKAIRYVIPEDDYLLASGRVGRHLRGVDELLHARRVCCYVHKDATREVHTRGILEWILSTPGKDLAVPVTRVKGQHLDISLVGDLGDLVPSTFGVLEPAVERLVPPSSVDAFIVPCLAVDGHGNRLGYGMGYYDRLFEHIDPAVPKIALAFDFQVMDAVPTTTSDRPVTIVVTESGVHRC